MDKAADAFRTISEVATDLDVPQHVLRFWETRFPTIRPLKRGGGRRYYRPDDVELLRGIRHLLYGQGYTIRGVQRIIKENGARHVQAVGRGEQIVVAAPPEPGDWREDREGDAPAGGFSASAAALVDASSAAAPALLRSRPSDGAIVLTPEDLDELRQALAELSDCARALAALKAG